MTPSFWTVTFLIICGEKLISCSASVVVGFCMTSSWEGDFLNNFSAIIAIEGQTVTFMGGKIVQFVSCNTPWLSQV